MQGRKKLPRPGAGRLSHSCQHAAPSKGDIMTLLYGKAPESKGAEGPFGYAQPFPLNGLLGAVSSTTAPPEASRRSPL